MEKKITSSDVSPVAPVQGAVSEIKIEIQAAPKPKLFSFDSLDKVMGMISSLQGIGKKIQEVLGGLDANGYLKTGKECQKAKEEIQAELSRFFQRPISSPEPKSGTGEKKAVSAFLRDETKFLLLPPDQQWSLLKGSPLHWSDADAKVMTKPGTGGWKEARLRFALALKWEGRSLETEGKTEEAAQFYHSASMFAPKDVGLHADAARLKADWAEKHLEAVADLMQAGKVEKLIHDGKLHEADQLAQKIKEEFFLTLNPLQRKILESNPKIRARLIEVNIYQAEIKGKQGDHAKASQIYRNFLNHLDKLIEEHPTSAEAYLIRAKVHHNLQEYSAAMKDYQALANACPDEAGYAEVYRQDLQASTKSFNREWHLAEAMQDPFKATVFVSEELKAQEALGDAEAVKALSVKLAMLSGPVAFGALMVKAQDFAAKSYLSPLNPALKALQTYISLSARADSQGYELGFKPEFQKLSDAKKLEVLQKLQQEGLIGLNRTLAAKETDANKKLYYEGKAALLEGNLSAARLKWMDFKAGTKTSPDSDVVKMRAEAGAVLRELNLAAVKKLAGWEAALLSQRTGSLVSVAATVDDPSLSYHLSESPLLLQAIQHYLESGRADTIEEALELMKTDYQKLQVGFQQDSTIKPGIKISYSHWIAAGKGVDQVTLAGGTLDMGHAAESGTQYPNTLKVVIGVEGGCIKTDTGTYLFPPGQAKKEIVIAHGCLKAGSLKGASFNPTRLMTDEEKKNDFTIYPYKYDPAGLICHSGKFNPNDPESLRLMIDYADHLLKRDPDFARLFQLETREGLEKTKTEEGLRAEFLSVAKAIRHRTGCYAVAGELLESVFAKDFHKAMEEIKSDELKKISDEVEKERPALEKKVLAELAKLKKDHPYEYSLRYPKGASDADVKTLVNQSVQGKIAIKVRKAAFQKMDAVVEKEGKLSDSRSTEAWKIYDDMKDPTDKTWNLADESWDGIVDEVVISAVTVPVTMGVGAAVRGTLGGTSLALRWAAQGGMRSLAVRGGVLFAGAVAEGLVMESLTPGTWEWKQAGLNTLMSVAFHGGGKAWGGAAKGLGVDDLALAALKAEGKSVAGKSALNFTGSMMTQTSVATAMSYAGDAILGHDNPNTFWERFGGETLRMLAFHYGTQAMHLGTGHLSAETDFANQTKMKEARESYLKWLEKGVSKEEAARRAVQYAQGLKVDFKTGAAETDLKAEDISEKHVAPVAKPPVKETAQPAYDAAALAGVPKLNKKVFSKSGKELTPGEIEVRKQVYMGAIELAGKFGFETINPFLGASFKKFAERLVSAANPQKLLADMGIILEFLNHSITGRNEAETKGLKETLLTEILIGKIIDKKSAQNKLLYLESRLEAGEDTKISSKGPSPDTIIDKSIPVASEISGIGKKAISPPPPSEPLPEIVIPKAPKVPLDLERKAAVTNAIFELVYPKPEGRPRYMEAYILEEITGISERLRDFGQQESVFLLGSDLEIAMKAPYDSEVYLGAIERLAKVVALRRFEPEFLNKPVEFMGDATLKKFSLAVKDIYEVGKPNAKLIPMDVAANPESKTGVSQKTKIASNLIQDESGFAIRFSSPRSAEKIQLGGRPVLIRRTPQGGYEFAAFSEMEIFMNLTGKEKKLPASKLGEKMKWAKVEIGDRIGPDRLVFKGPAEPDHSPASIGGKPLSQAL